MGCQSMKDNHVIKNEKTKIVLDKDRCVACKSVLKKAETTENLICGDNICKGCANYFKKEISEGKYYKCKHCPSVILFNENVQIELGPMSPVCVYCMEIGANTILPCQNIPNHLLHQKCLIKIFQLKENCPACNTKLLFNN